MSPIYRKKPMAIEARQVMADERDIATADWCSGRLLGDGRIAIATLEGTMMADPGDWVIRGVAGEFYPCKPDIFERTYEPAP